MIRKTIFNRRRLLTFPFVIMKYLAYGLSFSCQILNRSIRVAYSFCKPYIKKKYGTSNFILGIADSAFLLVLGITQIFRYSIGSNYLNVLPRYLFTSLLTSVVFGIFALLSLLDAISNEDMGWILVVLMASVGLLSYNIYVALFLVVQDYLNNQNDGGLIGFWASAGDFGTVVGLMLPSLLVVSLSTPWEVPILITASISAFASILLFLLVPRKKQFASQQIRNQQAIDPITFTQFWDSCRELFSSLDFAIYALTVCCAAPSFMGLFQWLPTYIHSQGEVQFSAYITLIFNVMSIIGAYFIGKLYQIDPQSSSPQRQSRQKIIYFATMFLFSLICAGWVYICINDKFSLQCFILLLVIEGFSLGGLLNVLFSNGLLKFAKGDERMADKLANLLGIMESLSGFLVEFIIGLCLGLNETKQDGSPYRNLFYVLLAISILQFALHIVKGAWRYCIRPQAMESLGEEQADKQL